MSSLLSEGRLQDFCYLFLSESVLVPECLFHDFEDVSFKTHCESVGIPTSIAKHPPLLDFEGPLVDFELAETKSDFEGESPERYLFNCEATFF
jgi:hypothetical protein